MEAGGLVLSAWACHRRAARGGDCAQISCFTFLFPFLWLSPTFVFLLKTSFLSSPKTRRLLLLRTYRGKSFFVARVESATENFPSWNRANSFQMMHSGGGKISLYLKIEWLYFLPAFRLLTSSPSVKRSLCLTSKGDVTYGPPSLMPLTSRWR